MADFTNGFWDWYIVILTLLGVIGCGVLLVEQPGPWGHAGLSASRFDPDQMARHIGADSLGFVSIDGLYRAMGDSGRDPMAPRFCDACFTGDYPIRPADADEGKVSVQLSLLTEPA